ncbi:hypothetical protein CARUB_v10004387mg [Capsella rubella]|uniref:Calmodulin-binding protein n=1 Tax=Capsella rubella TaxID=81985 RepID=R0GT21_9BRAS|nr:calmodulin-binding protein 60 D [Capsella rubella]XP_023633620.1 calmodulin-binding protein 60 D [Capsella rubella]EOA15470.1 hypothetical protein CARUB_v10004387mg [Capsella rubella]
MKRSLEGNDDDKHERKRPALASVIVEALKVDSLQKLCSSLEPILRRVVSEEVERALAKLAPASLTASSVSSPKRIGCSDGRNLQLHFKSRLSLPLFTGGRVEGEQGAAVHVVLIDANSGRPVTFGLEASLKLDVVVLGGDFTNENDEDWTQEEFDSHVVKEREGKRPLLTGDLCVVLKEGVGTLGEVTFTDNSSWIRSRKFRLGLRVASGYCGGIRIREAKTEAFYVKDHRGELYKKHYPPALNDEVWRLDKIGKDGAFHKKLKAAGIVTVEGFLRDLVKDSANLRAILGSGMSNKMWDVLVEHAKTCVLSRKLYVYYSDDSRTVGVVFNNIYELNGFISGDRYLSADSLSESQKVYVDELVRKAYENWNQVVEYEGKSLSNFNQPERLNISQNNPAATLANYSTTSAADNPIHVTVVPSAVPPNQSPVHSEFSMGEYNQTLTTAQPHNPQELFDIGLQQDQFMGIRQHQTLATIENANVTGFVLGPPQSATCGYQDIESSVDQGNLNLFDDWSKHHGNDLFSEEEIRKISHELLANEDMQELLQLFSMGGGNGEDGFAFPSFMHNTPRTQGSDEEGHGRSGKAVVGWLKIKAAMRWGFFIRRKAAERRAHIVELDDER